MNIPQHNKIAKDSTHQNQKGSFSSSVFFQPKLSINTPGDTYEQEADAMADKVMRMKNPAATSPPRDTFFKPALTVQRKAHGTDEIEDESLHRKEIPNIQRKCAACSQEDQQVQKKENSGSEMQENNELGNYVSSLNSSGQPLPESSRQFFEPRFGQDFSNVKIHTDSVAAKSAQSINALAYTTGNNIVFNEGQYSPHSESGQKLMAHELTHVLQQGGSENHTEVAQTKSDTIQRSVQMATIFPSENPPTDNQCHVFLGGRRIDHWTGTYAGFRHLYIDYYKNSSDYGVIEGGPVPSTATMGGGTSGAWVKPSTWESKGIQWEITPTSNCPSFIDCLKSQTSAYNSAGYPYHATHGPNSNSFAWKVLNDCGVNISYLLSSWPYLGYDYWTTHTATPAAPATTSTTAAPATP